MSGLTFAYQPPPEGHETHVWFVVGPDGGIHISATPVPEGLRFSGKGWYGGVETHRRTPPDYRAEDAAPDHAECWLLGGPCWHDGTSLYFSERIAPWFEGEDAPFSERLHNDMRAELRHWYRRLASDE